MKQSFWDIDFETCSIQELTELFKTTKRVYVREHMLGRTNTSSEMELYILLNWYRTRLGEPNTVFKPKITLRKLL